MTEAEFVYRYLVCQYCRYLARVMLDKQKDCLNGGAGHTLKPM